MEGTREPQYGLHFDVEASSGRAQLGLGSNATWNLDPIRLTFVLSRYKFVARMLAGQEKVLEVGCGDGFGSRIVCQAVQSLTVTDFDPVYVAEAARQLSGGFRAETMVLDLTEHPADGRYSAAYLLDVLEHIHPQNEDAFLGNLVKSLRNDGVAIVGMPSLESQVYASEGSRQGHINCKTGEVLRNSLAAYFGNVFVFSMNDEVVHTGFHPMAHYLMALCTNPLPLNALRA